MKTKSERTVENAFDKYDSQEGSFRKFLFLLIDFADRGVNNSRTRAIFERAIDSELSERDVYNEYGQTVIEPDEDAPRCVHCRSYSTYFRETDGDVACNNCTGIMPMDEGGDE